MNEKLIVGGSIGVGIVILIAVIFIFTGPSNSTNSQVSGVSHQIPSNIGPEAEERYKEYTEANLAAAFDAGQKPVVFFHASWCSYCIAAERDILSNFDKVPAEVTILKADFDSSIDLKRRLGVVTQDTFVQIDENGQVVAKWISGGQGINGLLANVN